MGRQTLETQVAIIGGGPGGYTAAFRAADLGLDVTLINDEERLGGVCLLRGCIPSKLLLEVAALIQEARQARAWGLDFQEPAIDLDGLRRRQDQVVGQLTQGLASLSRRREVQLLQGRATFDDSRTLRVEGHDGVNVRFEHAIIATGSRPVALPGSPFKDGSRIVDSKGALALPDVPETLLVIGGGYIGLELGTVYASLGSQVTLVEMTDGLLPGVDRDLVKPLAKHIDERFAAVHLNTKATGLREADGHVAVSLEGEVDQPQQRFERVLVAISRRPNSEELGLENTPVQVDDHGFVRVDEQRRTAEKHIFAIGDVAGGPMLAHKAMHEGKVAAEVIAGEPAAFDVRCIPAVVFTEPQIAWCGLTEDEARQQGHDVGTGRFPWRAAGRALTMDAGDGLTKLVFDANTQRVLGVGIVGKEAESLIEEGALAVEMGALAQDLALTIHPHPTLTETVGGAAEAFLGTATDILTRPRGSARTENP